MAFTPDEEIGQGTSTSAWSASAPRWPIRWTGRCPARSEDETFSASSVTVTIRGHSVHPGYAKDKMVNSIKLARAPDQLTPARRAGPETTSGREGYVHPNSIEGSVEQTVLRFIVRDFDGAQLEAHERLLQRL